MKLFLLSVILLALAPCAHSVSDRLCGNDNNNLWLDIILVIDNSQSTNVIYQTISQIFGPNSRIGTRYEDPRSSRVAIVTYNNEATTVAGFNTFKSLDQLKAQLNVLESAGSSGNESYLDQGLLNAQAILNNTLDRENYKKVVLVFASAYRQVYKNKLCIFSSYSFISDRPDYISQSMKRNGVTVMTIYTGIVDKSTKAQWKGTASDGFAFDMAANTTTVLQNALTTVNCFCLDYSTWTQFKHYGVCMLYPDEKKNQQAAHKYCKTLGVPANLATEFDGEKRKFNYKFINSFESAPVSSYWNGLMVEKNGTWYWDQPKGNPLIPLDPSSGSVNTSSGCVADVKHSDGSVSWTPISCSNSFYFLCEAKACDTDNYCDS